MRNKVLRLAVGSLKGSRSGVWRFWSNSKGNFYVANRCLGGQVKISFHKDRNCHFGFTSEYADKAKARFGVMDRHNEKLVIPHEPIVSALQILIPESELFTAPLNQEKKITWLDVPPQDSIGTVTLLICEKPSIVKLPEGSKKGWIVGKLEIEIRNAWILYAFTPMDKGLSRVITNGRLKLASVLKNVQIPDGTRATVMDSGTHHDRRVLELAC